MIEMTVSVGVVGAGTMGSTHVRTITASVRGARVAAVADLDLPRATAVARGADGEAGVYADAHDLIADEAVDAVLVASIAETHEELVLACLDAGKPVLCEKPLAVTAEASHRVVEAEAAIGTTLVQLGFMRRYDPTYVEIKRLLEEGEIGAPLLLHQSHRNPDAPPSFDQRMAITDSVVHEIDATRWLLGQEIVAATVLAGRATRHAPAGVLDPLVVLLETDGGVLVDVESFVRARYGYDIRCEIVGEDGTLALAPTSALTLRREGRDAVTVPGGFQSRFADAYRVELQSWIDGIAGGCPTGATAWDGYAAGAVTDAVLRALQTGSRAEVALESRPALYAGAER
jgi:myo-inositol 2-dehydrogenase/D-chiro-inositol 1-dehydrogenase